MSWSRPWWRTRAHTLYGMKPFHLENISGDISPVIFHGKSRKYPNDVWLARMSFSEGNFAPKKLNEGLSLLENASISLSIRNRLTQKFLWTGFNSNNFVCVRWVSMVLWVWGMGKNLSGLKYICIRCMTCSSLLCLLTDLLNWKSLFGNFFVGAFCGIISI